MDSQEKLYENFVQKHEAGTFFQSFVFGEFQEKIPYRGKSWAIVKNDGDATASCLAIKMRLPFDFSWLWVPYGPLMSGGGGEKTASAARKIFEDLGRIAREEKAIFARIEPPYGTGDIPGFIRKGSTYVAAYPAPKRFTPEYTLLLDITKPEEEILAQMKPKGRYNISVAAKKGVCVEMISGAEVKRSDAAIDQFHTILQQTGGRDGFGIHPAFFYKKLLETFGEKAALFAAYQENTMIAGIIVIFYKDTATYYYGASDYAHRSLMAPYLLQWEAIREAKKRGLTMYDFLGISPPGEKSDEQHPWAGVTEFKKKFGGEVWTYPPAIDLVYKPWLYKLLRAAGRI